MRSHKTRMADSIAARTGEPRDRAEAVVDLRIEQLLSTTATADNIARSQQQVTYMPHRALALTVPESIGVLGVIDPVSLLYELAQVIGKVLANCVTAVIIPSERYPLTVLAFCELLTLAEVPPGVINVVPGDQTKLTAALIENQNVTLWQPSGTQPLPVHVKTIWLPYGV
jgi:aldehyde dehydrogenase (NAD+)